jgi:site-specific recombinase XerD
MFEQLIEHPFALARHRNSPLAEQRCRFLIHCAGEGMTRKTLRNMARYLLVITTSLRLAERPDDRITLAEIEVEADRWANRPNRPSTAKPAGVGRRHFINYAARWLQFLGRWQTPVLVPPPYADRIAAFRDYMSRERGLAPATVTRRCWVAQKFLDRLAQKRRPLDRVTALQVDDALIHALGEGRLARISIHSYATALRAFFRFAEANGWCRRGLAESIRGPRLFAQEGLPSAPSWDDVCRLLATTEGDEPQAIRDRAILLLLTTYGCRAGEVVSLRLEDIDWQRELICFTQTKQRRTRTYPLAVSVGEALVRYLKVRPRSSHREVFLCLVAPIVPLSSKTVWWVVGPRLRALGVTLRHCGPHALRHACATHLLKQGFTIQQIGGYLGHRDLECTQLYAKVDIDGLREVADFDLGGLQ